MEKATNSEDREEEDTRAEVYIQDRCRQREETGKILCQAVPAVSPILE
jgi:hypothetical protein